MLRILWILLVVVFSGASVEGCGDHAIAPDAHFVADKQFQPAAPKESNCEGAAATHSCCCGIDGCGGSCAGIQCRCCQENPITPTGATTANVFRCEGAKTCVALSTSCASAFLNNAFPVRPQRTCFTHTACPLFLVNRSIRL